VLVVGQNEGAAEHDRNDVGASRRNGLGRMSD
jgi:hypothetical protein